MQAERDARPDPEALLRQVQAAERAEGRDPLKIFLGYAPGVGKSFRMFDEGRRRVTRGEDVVVAAMQQGTNPEVEEIVRNLETIPTIDVGGAPVVNVAAILIRHPQVCLIDGLAYDNPPGSLHPKRYQDVDALLAAGISVLTSLHLEYIAEQQEFVERVTGRRHSETVPQEFVRQADEIAIVDAPATELSELRRRALLLAADIVDHHLESYRSCMASSRPGARRSVFSSP
jgi:two-component system, OmpR family, sensor histidine kinase KdpD